MKYLKKHLITLLVILLLSGCNTQAALGKSFKLIKGGGKFSHKPSMQRLKIAKFTPKQETALKVNFIQKLLLRGLSSSSTNKEADVQLFNQVAKIFNTTGFIEVKAAEVKAAAFKKEPTLKEKDILNIIDNLQKNLTASWKEWSEQFNNIKKLAPELVELSTAFVQQPSLQPIFKEYIAKHPGLAVLGEGMKDVLDLNQTALTLVQQKNLVLKGTELVEKFEKNAFGKPIEQLLKLTEKEVLSAFKKLALNMHPDKGGNKELFVDLAVLKDLLISPEGRALLKIGEFRHNNPKIVALSIEGKISVPDQLEILLREASSAVVPEKLAAITLPEATSNIAKTLGEKTSAAAVQAIIDTISKKPSGNGSLPPIIPVGGEMIAMGPDNGPAERNDKLPLNLSGPIMNDGDSDEDEKEKEIEKRVFVDNSNHLKREEKETEIKPVLPITIKKKKKKIDYSDLIRRAEALRNEMIILEKKIDAAIAL